MADWAHDWTDDEIERLERRFRRQYNQAAREMRERLEDMMKTFDKKNSEWKDKVKSGEASKKDYEKWLQDQLTDQDFVRGMSSELAKQANQANQLAMQTINDAIPSVFTENANYAAFGIEQSIGKNTHSFDLYDQDTVRRLIAEQPELLPPLQKPKMDNGRDLRWNRQKFASAITQSILQGESIPHAAERIGRVMRMNEAAAVRAARTAITGAENAGRVDSYKRAERIGIELEQEWMATFDNRTRMSHRELHGQHVPVGKYFIASRTTGNKLLYPGDPTADPSEVYGCRCTLVAWFPDIEQEEKPLWTDWKDGTTYDEWKAGKIHEAERKEASGVVDGKDILATWKRREGEFGFEIEDVIDAQGFNGKPRVVPANEFDAAVRAANGGSGFIAQRTYSAPDKETLDAYRQQLYDGKWYVDCSTGGAKFGQGMYCAANYEGVLTEGMAESMEQYRVLGESRIGAGSVSYVETFTLDPSARIIKYEDLLDIEDSVIDRMEEDGTIDNMPSDMGALAAAMGYDAISADGHGKSGNYTVILNRTKLIIRKPE